MSQNNNHRSIVGYQRFTLTATAAAAAARRTFLAVVCHSPSDHSGDRLVIKHSNRVFTRSSRRRANIELAQAGLLEPRPLAQVEA